MALEALKDENASLQRKYLQAQSEVQRLQQLLQQQQQQQTTQQQPQHEAQQPHPHDHDHHHDLETQFKLSVSLAESSASGALALALSPRVGAMEGFLGPSHAGSVSGQLAPAALSIAERAQWEASLKRGDRVLYNAPAANAAASAAAAGQQLGQTTSDGAHIADKWSIATVSAVTKNHVCLELGGRQSTTLSISSPFIGKLQSVATRGALAVGAMCLRGH